MNLDFPMLGAQLTLKLYPNCFSHLLAFQQPSCRSSLNPFLIGISITDLNYDKQSIVIKSVNNTMKLLLEQNNMSLKY